MTRSSGFGLTLAVAGALILSPDALFMRLSGMDALQMSGWRGVCMGAVMWAGWLLTSGDRAGDLRRLCCGAGLVLIVAQIGNALFFSLGIANAPVAIVMMGVAATPVWAALISQFALGEPASRATWWTIAAVLAGMAVALFGGQEASASSLKVDAGAMLGAFFGLATALVLAINFVTLRARPSLPLLPTIGTGALIAGGIGWWVTGPVEMMSGVLWAIMLTGALILPLSFFLLSQAARYTHAAHVSLILLLEAVLSPIWVWLVLGESLAFATLAGAAIVIGALVAFLSGQRARARA